MNDKMSQAIAAARSGQSQKAQVLLAQILKQDQTDVNAWFLLSHLVEAPEKKTAFLNKVLTLDPQHQKAQQALAALQPLPAESLVPVSEPEPIATPEPFVEPEPEVIPEPEPNIVEAEAELEEQETAYNLEEKVDETAVPRPIIAAEESNDDLLVQAENNALPSWLTDDDDVLKPEDLAAEALSDFTESAAKEDLPDWLTNTIIDEWTAEKPWEQAEDSLEALDFDDDEIDVDVVVEEKMAPLPEPEPEIVKSAVDVAAEHEQEVPAPLPNKLAKPSKRTSDRTLNIVLIILIIVAFLVLIGLLFIVISNL